MLTPLPRTSQEAIDLAHELVDAVEACPFLLEPERHDRLVPTISHLPYLAAGALVHTVADVGEADPLVWELAAGGFRDTSRVAASDTRMFLDILMTNRSAVLDQLDALLGHLHSLRAAHRHGRRGPTRRATQRLPGSPRRLEADAPGMR